MIIIHALIAGHQLCLWAERTTGAKPSDFRKKERSAGQPQRNETIKHPNACNAQELKEIVDRLAVIAEGWRITNDAETLFEITLPTVNGQPILSTDKSVASITTVERFSVDVLQLNPQQAIMALASIKLAQVNTSLKSKLALAPEILILVDLASLAARLTNAQQFLPSARENRNRYSKDKGNEYIAEWQPLFSAIELAYLTAVAKTLPAVSLATNNSTMFDSETSSFSTGNKITALQHYIQGLVDCLVRIGSATPIDSAIDNTGLKQPDRGFSTNVASVHEAWLMALTSQNSNVIDFNSPECERLCQQLEEWQRPITNLRNAPFRLCFRLDEPEPTEETMFLIFEERLNAGFNAGVFLTPPPHASQHSQNENWQVSYHLQSLADPSLIVSAEEVWHGNKKTKAVINPAGFAAREYLLLALGQASRIYPAIENSLRTSTPISHTVDNESAFKFLKEKALLLEEAGFGVIVPSWWTSGKKKIKVKAKFSMLEEPIKGTFGAGTVAEFDYQAALGDKSLSFEELAEIARLKSPIVNIRGEWIHIDQEQLALVLKHWKRNDRGTLRDLLKVALTDEHEGFEFDEIITDRSIKDLLDQLKEPSMIKILNAPSGLNAELRPYQLAGYSWLNFLKNWGLGACLADDMGLGKTIQTLAMIQNVYNDKELYKPILIVCPTSVMSNWFKESQRFTPALKLMIHHGDGRLKGENLMQKVKNFHIVISSYPLLFRDQEHFKAIEWEGIILDEAQNIKNFETKQAQAARALSANYRIALTGTPVENNVRELWSLMLFLNPGLLGSRRAFDESFHKPIQRDDDINAKLKLQQITRPFILRRMKTDKSIIKDLPDKQESKVYCQLTREQASLYGAVLNDFNSKIGDTFGLKRAALIVSTLTKLKQVCNHPAQFLQNNSSVPGRSGKLVRLVEIVREIIAAKEKVLIFTQYTAMGDLLKPYLEDHFGCPVFYLHGGVPRKMRDTIVDSFRHDLAAPIFILSIKAGGTGLNLVEANHVIHFDRWWNPAVENQATDRAFRIGQIKNVQVHKFVCTGTVEEKIDDMIEKKQKLADDVVGTGENWLTQLSNEDVRNVFAISREVLLD